MTIHALLVVPPRFDKSKSHREYNNKKWNPVAVVDRTTRYTHPRAMGGYK
jgi:hypothetical protein